MKLKIELNLDGEEFASQPKIAIGKALSEALAVVDTSWGDQVTIYGKDKSIIGYLEIIP